MAFEDSHIRLERLVAKYEPIFQGAFMSMVERIRNARTLRQIADLIEQGRLDEGLDILLRSASQLGDPWVLAFNEAGSSTAETIRKALAEFQGVALSEIVLSFDSVHDGAVNAIRGNRLRMIREFTASQRNAVREAILEGIRRGANPLDQARAFRNTIGLTVRQTRAVANFRRLLENRDRAALSRALRDRRFDRAIESAIMNDRPLNRQQIDRMVNRFRERSLRRRAETIARTEALRSVHEGTQAMYDQAIESGELDPDQLVRIWNTARDERVRGSHVSMHEQERRVNEPFISGRGNQLMRPGDPGAPPDETIQCRCVVGTRIKEPIGIGGF